jgi:predicted ATPase
VPPLSLPDAGTEAVGRPNVQDHRQIAPAVPPERLLQSEAVRLFVERATAVTPAFALTEQNAAAVAQLCRRLDGIPRAIELAARLRALTVDQIAARLDDRFRLLTVGGRTAPPRQQTLRATMDWSYDPLSEPERILLRRLAVFAGGSTVEAVEAVCRDGDTGVREEEVLDLLTLLVDKSLVTFDAPEGAEPRSVCTRYRLLDTVREYARQRLEQSGEAETVRSCHHAFYLRLAENAAPYLAGPDQVAWLERLDAEQENLRAALDGSLEKAPEQALRLVGALAGFWEERGHLEEGRQRLAAALERAGPVRRSPAGAAALAGASALVRRQGDRPSARALLEESVAIQRELGDRAGIAASLARLALLASHRDDCETARVLDEESLAIQRELGDQAGIATVLAGLGLVAHHQQEYTHARSLHEQSLAIRRALGDRHGIAQSLVGLGDATLNQGDSAAARAYYEQALAMSRELGDRIGVASALGQLANVFQEQRDYTQARRLREESLALWRATGFPGAVFHALGALGHLARKQGEYHEAQAFYAESLRLRVEREDTHAIAESLEDVAELAAAQQQWYSLTCLLGAATLRAGIGAPMPPAWQAERDGYLAAARAALGEQAFETASAAGRAMTMEEAVRYALSASGADRRLTAG